MTVFSSVDSCLHLSILSLNATDKRLPSFLLVREIFIKQTVSAYSIRFECFPDLLVDTIPLNRAIGTKNQIFKNQLFQKLHEGFFMSYFEVEFNSTMYQLNNAIHSWCIKENGKVGTSIFFKDLGLNAK